MYSQNVHTEVWGILSPTADAPGRDKHDFTTLLPTGFQYVSANTNVQSSKIIANIPLKFICQEKSIRIAIPSYRVIVNTSGSVLGGDHLIPEGGGGYGFL